MSHHFDCILVIRSKLLGPVPTEGKGITQEYEHQEMGTWDHFKTANHIWLSISVC